MYSNKRPAKEIIEYNIQWLIAFERLLTYNFLSQGRVMLSIAIDSQAKQIQHTDNGFILRHRVFPKALTIGYIAPILPVRSATGIW